MGQKMGEKEGDNVQGEGKKPMEEIEKYSRGKFREEWWE